MRVSKLSAKVFLKVN